MHSELAGRCTVCGRSLSERRIYGNRHYCEHHLTLLSEDVGPVWQASIITLGFLLVMVAGIAATGALFGLEPAGNVRLVAGVTITLLPLLVWLFLLYRFAARSRTDLSPLIPTVLVLAALVAAAITRPLLTELINLDDWLARANAINRFIAHILLDSTIHIFTLYAIVRYTVWRTPAFEHRVDGVLFTLVAGWGYGSMLNLLFMFDQGGLSLVNGSFRLITQLCAYLSASLIVGYFLGRCRFEDMPFYYLSAGITLAAGITGLLLYAGAELNNIGLNLTSDGFSPWPGLVVNVLALIITFAAIQGLLRRHNALTRARLEQQAT